MWDGVVDERCSNAFLDVCYELHAFWSRAFWRGGRLDACSFFVTFLTGLLSHGGNAG
jgi:hypothetical protein